MTGLNDMENFSKVGHLPLPEKYKELLKEKKKFETEIKYYRTTKGIDYIFRRRQDESGILTSERYDPVDNNWVIDGYLSVFFSGSDVNFKQITEKEAKKFVEDTRLRTLDLPIGQIYSRDLRIEAFSRKRLPPT